MKFFYIIFLLIILNVGNSFSQDLITNVFHLDKLTPEGILLDKGWKFCIGDNPDFAKPDFDDKAWEPINPTLDIHDSLPQISKSGICWFRLHLSLDSNLLKSQLAFVIQQSGASEIYLNGYKIQNYGLISDRPDKIKAYDPLWKPLSVTFKAQDEQILSVRFVLQPNTLYTTIFETSNPAFSIRMMYSDNAIDYYHQHELRLVGFGFAIFGICIMIVIIHLSFYFLYPSQKANLYFALFAMMYGLACLVQLAFWLYPNGVVDKFFLGNSTFALFIAGYIFILVAAYYFLEWKRDFFYYSLLTFSGIAVILDAWPYALGWKLGGPTLQMLVQLNIARIAFLSIIKKQRGAWIIAAGAVCSFIFFVAFLSQGTYTNTSFVRSLQPVRMFTYMMFNLSLPAATSVFLAFEFAFTNRILQQKLIENSELSQKNLLQEKEKQQILAAQNETLDKQVTTRTAELKQSLENLKSTQSQLIQSEKMASLGELTAGIAHEIENPLNFVNNFSEVSNELMDEMKEEFKKGDIVEGFAIASDIKQNLEKILLHGKRADAIVKGMLQHSRSSSGVKEPTELNKLADEYLRLAYHGLRAKDKSFNATLKTDFDQSIGTINVVPQDIGRAVLNLITNAFYAITEKKQQQSDGYEPTVSVSTKKAGAMVLISVKDNGIGIPQKVMDKIFQPFFTTKPTGQGTGLGLSMSYDIIKAHGGEIKLETKEGEGSEFIILIPMNQ